MTSYTPQTNLWIERSRLAGMVLEGVLYGILFLLTAQSLIALARCSRHEGKFTNNRLILVLYIVVTFILATISTVTVAKYTEMIWIDLRDAPGGPLALIEHSLEYRINIVALCCGHIQEWFMQVLLVHRCFVIWDWRKLVTIPMTACYVAMIGLSIVVQVESSIGIAFYNINTQLAYLCIEVGLNVIYTILVAYRLFAMRNRLKEVVPQYDSSTYDTIVIIIVESTMVYTTCAIVFIIAFSLDNVGLTTLCYMSIGKVQGIVQLFIILRAARGKGVSTNEWPGRTASTTVQFSHSVLDGTDEGTPEQNIHTYSVSEKVAADVSEVI